MAQYQSFPDVTGDSQTLGKLKALKLPELSGLSFLDVGCNEGFFCGFAHFQGAARVLGVDSSAGFIERARARFPACEFICAHWDRLPDEHFDVILLASALHYAEDQVALLQKLVDMLTPDGVLVLELGICSSAKAEWVNVVRGIDERVFPTMPMLQKVLGEYAWKWMGPSVSQSGDPVSRHVIHVSRLKPVAYLMLEPPGFGKSTLARQLFARAGIPVVAGDEVILQVVKGRRTAPEPLRRALEEDFSPFSIDRSIQVVFEQGLGANLIALWTSEAQGRDFALDMYVPPAHQDQVRSSLAEAGFMPVVLNWQRAGLGLPSAEQCEKRADSYFVALAEGDFGGREAVSADGLEADSEAGFIDELVLKQGSVSVRGWAVTTQGLAPQGLEIRVGEQVHQIHDFVRQSRSDVQRHLGLPHPLFGYLATVALPVPDMQLGALVDILEVRVRDARGGTGRPLPMSKSLLSAAD